jgi:hypothetical protein
MVKSTSSRQTSSVVNQNIRRGAIQANICGVQNNRETFPFMDKSFAVMEHENLDRLDFRQRYQSILSSQYGDAESIFLDEVTEQVSTKIEYRPLRENEKM